MSQNIETSPWTVEIERNGLGRVSHVRVLAAEPRIVFSATYQADRDRAGNHFPVPGSMTVRKSEQPAIVADCGIPYAGLSVETLLAHGDLISAAPDLDYVTKLYLEAHDAKAKHESAGALDQCCCEICVLARKALAKASGNDNRNGE